MTNEIYNLYKENLLDIVRSEETVKRILNDKNNYIIDYKDNGKLIGISVINKNTIYLICVDKPFQKRGIGTELLIKSENYIASNGFNKIVVSEGKDYITPGVPMNNGAHKFFIKRGYVHSWGDCGCFDMGLMLKDFNYNKYSVGDTINKITYRWATINDFNNIVKCISAAEEHFMQYYQDKGLYEKGTNTPVLIAEKDNEILGVIIVCIEIEGKDTGSVGCTATTHKHRNKGIATNMVMLGTKYLKDIGLSRAVLGYTYTDIVNMYGKAGYKVTMEYFMGEKAVKNIHE